MSTPDNPYIVAKATLDVLREIRDSIREIADNTGKTPQELQIRKQEKAVKSAPISIGQNHKETR
ncbi:MAG: hypothetical protein ABSF28_07770 [Terracidiphilus sp.]|jgi:hypothetical protein